MKYDLISYASDFVSYLIQKSKNADIIRHIILFGSVARFESDKNSDIDIFIDVVNKEDEIEKECSEIIRNYSSSVKYTKYWHLLGIKNRLKLTVGDLKKWELRNSIISNGITLYGKYKAIPDKGNFLVLFSFENIKPNSKRVMLNKRIFGYSHSGKMYDGLLQKYKGIRLSKGTILVPIEHSNQFMQEFREFKIAVKIRKILDYS